MEPAAPGSPASLCWPWGCPAAVGFVRAFVAARSAELGHLAWYAPHVEAYRREELQHMGDVAYLDYAGAALYSRAQVQAAGALLLEGLLANPHTSPATEALVARARAAILELFGASTESHSLVFTAGATHALQLLGESFAWEPGGVFLYAGESHTSILGLRQFARRVGAACGTFELEDLPSLCTDFGVAVPLANEAGEGWPPPAAAAGRRLLLAFPGESNFSGAHAELGCVAALRQGPLRWRVLLDAAKLACTPGLLDLGACPVDFTVVSFYKIFGYPTGLGALIVRHDAAPLLAPRGTLGAGAGPSNAFGAAYFGGGSVASVSASSSFAVPRPNLVDWLERGTPHFLGIAALPSQLAAVRALGPDGLRRRHAAAVCREAYVRMRCLQHDSGQLLCTIFGRHAEARWWEAQGPTIAALLHFRDGSPVPYGLVLERATARGVVLRAGCHCNAGGCQRHLGLSDADIRRFFASGKVCGDDLGVIEGRATGVVRVSFGPYSTLGDVGRWLALLREEFLDRAPGELPGPARAVGTEAARATPLELPPHSAAIAPLPVPQPPPAAVPPAPILPREAPVGGTSGGGAGSGGAAGSGTAGGGASLAPVPAPDGRVVGLKVYPLKGCGPLRCRRWPLDPATGALLLDRRWCLAPSGGGRLRPLSAKQAPRLTQVRLALRLGSATPGPSAGGPGPALVLWARGRAGCLELPLAPGDAELLHACGAEAEEEGDETPPPAAPAAGGREASDSDGGPATRAARWFDELLGLPGLRLVEAGAAPGTGEAPAHSHFTNAPRTLLLVSTASLQAFGRLCGLAVPAQRFRANLEVDFDIPFAEDGWPAGHPVDVGAAQFEAAGRCVRCQAVDVDPEDPAATGPSLLAALATAQPGGPSGKGPTFGVLLRPCGGRGAEACRRVPLVLHVGAVLRAHGGAGGRCGGPAGA